MKHGSKIILNTLTNAMLISTSACPALANASHSQMINLRTLTKADEQDTTQGFKYWQGGGYFVQLVDDSVVFFRPGLYHSLRVLRDHLESQTSLQEKVVIYYPKSHRVKSSLAIFTCNQGVWKINGIDITLKSLDRLRLTEEWNRVLKYHWPLSCSIAKLGNGKFLVTGGIDHITWKLGKPYDNAFIYDSASDEIVDGFGIGSDYSEHSSFLLPDGRIALVGGRESTFAVLDLRSKSVVDKPFEFLPRSATCCLDDNGNPIAFGGDRAGEQFTLKRIIKYDVAKDSFEIAGNMRTTRCFSPGTRLKAGQLNEFIPEAVEMLKDGTFVVCGGEYIGFYPFADFCSGMRENAEIVSLKNQKK